MVRLARRTNRCHVGVAFTAEVNSLVKDIFTPMLGLAIGGIDFTNLFITLKGPSEPTSPTRRRPVP